MYYKTLIIIIIIDIELSSLDELEVLQSCVKTPAIETPSRFIYLSATVIKIEIITK